MCFTCSYNMMSLLFHLYLLIWCEAAQTLTDQQTQLGQNVSINCDLVETEVYWFLLNLSYSVLILRSFQTPFYYNERFRLKYSVNSSRLLINNVTTDELGVYYCMSTNKQPEFSNGTRLYITEETPQTECQNNTVVQFIQQNQTSWLTLALMTGLWILVLVVVIIGYMKVYGCRNRLAEQNTGLQITQVTQHDPEQSQLQDVEVDTSMLSNNPPAPVNSTYVALELPKPQTHA
nr:uncharacterized protein LOC100534659 isoform X1 [Danio rerio]XP_021329213.1 uncharacterized protein LOC100534659 isoform X1 [Danio rerio]|eukprot:XP_017208790.1 uncharacterized protein LOC100534659 isoform X1 [Danio rerio]